MNSKWEYINSSDNTEYIRIGDVSDNPRRVEPSKIASQKVLREGLILDLDKNGNVVGIEII